MSGYRSPIWSKRFWTPRNQRSRLARGRATIEAVEQYAKTLDPAKYQNALRCAEPFIDYYTANGWKVGRASMKDWHAAFRNWVRRQSNFNGGKAPADEGPMLEFSAEARKRKSEIERRRRERAS